MNLEKKRALDYFSRTITKVNLRNIFRAGGTYGDSGDMSFGRYIVFKQCSGDKLRLPNRLVPNWFESDPPDLPLKIYIIISWHIFMHYKCNLLKRQDNIFIYYLPELINLNIRIQDLRNHLLSFWNHNSSSSDILHQKINDCKYLNSFVRSEPPKIRGSPNILVNQILFTFFFQLLKTSFNWEIIFLINQ